MTYIQCKQVVKAYRVADHEIVALRGIDFAMQQGEMVAIVGPSGAGKSSLLNLLGGLDLPTAGKLFVNGQDLTSLSQGALTRYRGQQVGFLWQRIDRNLLFYRTALQNVTLPMILVGSNIRDRVKRARELLIAVGLEDYADQYPAALSGGQQQRVALAVALANRPTLLLADEPTGALDRNSSRQVMALLDDLRQQFNLTTLLTTHDPVIADYADRVLTLRDGALGQDIAGADTNEAPTLKADGSLLLPTAAQSQLRGSPQIAVEIRPEGVLLRPERKAESESGFSALPAEAPPRRSVSGFLNRLLRNRRERAS